MDDLIAQLAELESKAEAVRRQIAQGPCRQYGHTWKSSGGCNAGCSDDCCCSVSVNFCEKCGDCDYGENEERADVLRKCLATGDGN